MGQHGLAFGPAGDAFPQCAALVPAGLACGEDGVEVYVRFDIGRGDQGALGVDAGACLGCIFGAAVGRGDGHEVAAVDVQVDQTGPVL